MVDPIDLTPEKNGGVLKIIKKEGSGTAYPTAGNTVYVHYVGTLENGEKFDSSKDRDEPFSFALGKSQVIKGWDLGVATMKKGEICDLICRSDYAYGGTGSAPKIPPDATLTFEVELIRWEGEDISPDRDGTITRTIIVEGTKHDAPSETSTVTAHVVGTYNDIEFYNKDVSFILGEGSEIGLPEGVDRALRRFNKGEKSTIHLKGARFTYGAEPPKEYNLPPFAEIDFTIFLKDFEKVKASWELTGDEKLEEAEKAKSRGTMFLQQNKYKLAIAKYTRIKDLLEYENTLEGEKKEKRDALFLAGFLNSGLAWLKLGETVECIKCCDKSLEIAPKNVKALYRKAQALQLQNDVEEAIPVYKKVLELEPSNKAAVQQIAICKQALHRIREKEKKRFKGMFEMFAAKQEEEMGNGDRLSPDQSSKDVKMEGSSEGPVDTKVAS